MSVTTTDCSIDPQHVLYLRDGVPTDCSGCSSAEAFARGHVHTVPIEELMEPIRWLALCQTMLGIERDAA